MKNISLQITLLFHHFRFKKRKYKQNQLYIKDGDHESGFNISGNWRAQKKNDNYSKE